MNNPTHTKPMTCSCGCGSKFNAALNVLQITDAACLLRGYKPPKLETPDLFEEAV